jgi:hypothetical protein
MTFALRDFDAIKKHFNDTITVILDRDNLKSIGELPPKRKEEFLFLKAVLKELEALIQKNPRGSKQLYIEIFYGAMLVINKDIENNLGHLETHSTLSDRLIDGMGITKTSAPDKHQVFSYYQALNNFLKIIYKDEDSRNGLKPTHALDSVSLDKLVTFVNTSYKLEETTYSAIVGSLVSEGKGDVHSNGFTAIKEIPATAISQFTTFVDLKEALDVLILKELSAKDVAKVTAIKNPDRAAQILSLQIIADTLTVTRLTSIKAPERLAILAGMMLLVREQIASSPTYKKAPFSNDDIPGSVIHTGLTRLLKAKEISPENAEALITAAQNFITYMTIQHREDRGVVIETFRKRHIFSGVIGFNLPQVLDLMQKSITTCRIEALNRSAIELKATIPRESTSTLSSYLTLSGWLGKKPVSTARTGIDEEKAEEKESKEEKRERNIVV